MSANFKSEAIVSIGNEHSLIIVHRISIPKITKSGYKENMDGINGRRGVEMEEGIGRKSREQEKDLPPLYGGAARSPPCSAI